MTTLMVPEGYESFLKGLKERVRAAQLRAGLSVNRELVLLYWSIGRDILARQKDQGWGSKVIDRLAGDLAGLMSAAHTLRLPAQDPELGRTETLQILRKAKGLIVSALGDALDATRARGPVALAHDR